MLTIGEFSRLAQVPAKTLRYYDDIGLFRPARVDPFTQYRYYSADQMPRLYRILALRGLGLSLEQIAHLLDRDLPAEQIRGMLRLKQAELQEHIETEQRRLAYVEATLRQIEEDGTMSEYEVILKDVEPVRVAGIAEVVPTRAQIPQTLGRLFGTLTEHLKAHHSAFAGPATVLYTDEEFCETNLHLEATIPFTSTIPETGQVKIRTLPAGTMASVVHHGPFESLDRAYGALFRWIDGGDYRVTGPVRELTLQYDPAGDPQDYVTELQCPVAKRKS